MRKNLLLVCSALLAPVSAFADNAPVVTLGGELNTQIGYINQEKHFRTVNGGTRNNKAIVNDTKITVDADGEANGLKYGASIKINTDTSPTKTGNTSIGDKTMAYVEGAFGRVEGGNTNGSTDKMKVSAANIAVATGGIDGDFKNWISPNTSDGYRFVDVFVSDPYLPIGCDCSTRIGKISYYTPNINGFSFGISYLPNSSVKGTASVLNDTPVNGGAGYRNLVESAINYSYKFNDIDLTLGLSNQYGEARKRLDNVKDRHDLNAWEVGAQIAYNGFTLAGSYSDWGKSGTERGNPSLSKQGGHLWTLGAAYTYDKFGASVTYYQSKRAGAQIFDDNGPVKDGNKNTFFSNKKHNKLEVLSFGVEHNTFPGFKPYAEVTLYKHNKKDVAINNKGEVYLTGIKITF